MVRCDMYYRVQSVIHTNKGGSVKTIWIVNKLSGKIDNFEYETENAGFYIGKNGRILSVIPDVYERHFDDRNKAIKFAYELTKTLITNYTKNIKNLEAQKMHIGNLMMEYKVKCV